MFLNEAWISNINFIDNSLSYNQFILFLFFLFLFSSSALGQWVNNPSQNNKLVIDAANPVNISTAQDHQGGAFIFWEDNKSGISSDIYFLHIDANGKASFRADGKKVSDFNSSKVNPITAVNDPGTAVVIWKDFSRRQPGDLFAQKVFNNGNLLWANNGLQISRSDYEVSDYSASSDKRGNTFISFVEKEGEIGTAYNIILQKINSSGRLSFPLEGVAVSKSPSRKTMTSVIGDDDGGAYIFWIENQNNKTVILSRQVDSTGKALWGKNPVMVSNPNHSVITYSVEKTADGSLYCAWQIQQSDKDVYHQLISSKGKILWGSGGKNITSRKGHQTNPQVLTADSSIILSWTNEIENNDKNIFIQKYNSSGKGLWKDEGVPVIALNGNQFGQKLLGDGKGGAIVSWIDRRVDSLRANIYAQRITSKGEVDWDSTALAVANHPNTEKSYVSIVSDTKGGIIALFRENRDGENAIYGQKIFNTGTYVSQIVGFTAQTAGDSVKISWYSANELGNTTYDIERTSYSDASSSDWKVIKTIYSEDRSSAKYYEFFDRPEESGTIYYRVVQYDGFGNIQPSDVAKLTVLEGGYDIIVAQNFPNPFTDETTIGFYLPHGGRVKVEFFNSKVEKLSEMEEHFVAGQNRIKFNSNGLRPGIYFYKFTLGEFVDVKKMVITN